MGKQKRIRKQRQSKSKQIGSAALASLLTMGSLYPYAVLNVQALALTQDNSTVGSMKNNINLLGKLIEEETKRSNKSADEVIGANFANPQKLTSSRITQSGNYYVDSRLDLLNVVIEQGVSAKIWIKNNATLSIKASEGSRAGYNNSTKGQTGYTALTISAGASLTIVGEGTLNIQGGTGGTGGIWNTQSSANGFPGGDGGTGGYAISNSGALTFDSVFTGKANIIGGTGGTGGTGQKSGDNYLTSTAGYVAGAGGAGGTGGVAVLNIGKITIQTDATKYNLSMNADYATGNVNIKGGHGGNGGAGGAAGHRSVEYFYNPPQYSEGPTIAQNNGQQSNQNFAGDIVTVTTSGYQDKYILYPNTSGNGGRAGQGGIAVSGGTINVTAGLSTIEGGNPGAPGSIGSTATSQYLTNGIISYTYTIYTWNKTTYETSQDDQGNVTHHVVSTDSGNSFTKQLLTTDCISSGTTYGNVGNYALSGVTVNQTGGTCYAFSGAGFSYDAVYGGRVERNGGNFFSGAYGNYGYGPTSKASAIRLSQLQGYESDTDKDGKPDSQNYYVLNKGDQYIDVNGDVKTAKGILVNGKEYGSKDVFVDPQGYVYLKNVDNTDKVELQVAIGGKRIGDIGSDTKYVTSEAGIYTFKGNGTTLTATFASDETSMDIDWLAEQMSEDFAGKTTNGVVEVKTAYQLAALAYAVNHGMEGAANAHIQLQSNIDLDAMNWTPIGTEEHPFIGVFDGNNKTIKNMRLVTLDNVNGYGLFGYTKGFQDNKNITSLIKNLTIDNGNYECQPLQKTVKYNGFAGYQTSGAGYTNPVAVASLQANGDIYAGAVVGNALNTAFENVKVENVGLSVNATQNAYAGGIVGYDHIIEGAIAQKISGCQSVNNKVNVKADQKAYAGGIVGQALDIDIYNSLNLFNNTGATGRKGNADITANGQDDSYAGGIVGESHSTILKNYRTIEGCEMNGNARSVVSTSANGTSYSGGIIGCATDIELRFTGTQDHVIANKISANAQTGNEAYSGGIVGKMDVKETAYRSIDGANVSLTGSDNMASDAKNNAYLGGIAGYARQSDVVHGKVDGIAAKTVTSKYKDVFTGGSVGYSERAIINDVTIKGKSFIGDGKTGAHAAGSVGYANHSSVTNQKISLSGSVKANAERLTGTYAGGIVGQLEFLADAANANDACLSNNTLKFTSTATVEANSKGTAMPSYAGGIVGDAVNVSVYGNEINTSSTVKVKAHATSGKSYSGGMAGRIDNRKTNKSIIITDTKINNVSVVASGETDEVASGDEAYAGGIAGQAIADEVYTSNVKITGTAATVTALGQYDTYAARLFGHTTRATILNSSPSANQFVKAVSKAGDVYAAGIVGRLESTTGKFGQKEVQSTITTTSVSGVNVTGEAGSSNTTYVGSIIGDGEYVQLTKSNVNHNVTTSGTKSTLKVAGQNAYVGGIAGRIINPDQVNQIPYTVESTTSVKTDASGVKNRLVAGGMYGTINNVRIASSYARNYYLSGTIGEEDLYGGLFGEAKDVRLIQVYGTDGNNTLNGIGHTNGTGIAAKLTGKNQFYGVYTTQTQWAKDADGKEISATRLGTDNIFQSCYYHNASGKTVVEEQRQNGVWSSTAAWGQNNYDQYEDLFALKDKDGSQKYYDSLKAVNTEEQDLLSKSMLYTLHFSTNNLDTQELKDISNQDITTSFEKELDYRLTYSTGNANINGNFNMPVFTEPHFLTLVVNPGVQYGHVDENSSVNKPGSQKFGKGTMVQFTAIPQDVEPESSFWYEFSKWTIQKVDFNSNGEQVLSNPSSIEEWQTDEEKNPTLDFKMPDYDVILTANFVQKDNQIRRNINKEINEGMIYEVNRRSQLPESDPHYINKNNIPQDVLEQILTEVGTDVLAKYIGTTNNSYRNNMERVYDVIKGDPYNAYATYDNLKDPDRVLQL